ncbi:MAG: AmmeMemoRadiSam system protein B [Treponema sp.]|jgi:AmmeMemoRadiSam system protein B|nr:AmmeMemoRadiSam system protein B [Treponema sp.]
MKKTRKPCLPAPWYPRDPVELMNFLDPFARIEPAGDIPAAVAPHAGWRYSGVPAAKAAAALAAEPADTVAVIGGHLPGGAKPLFAMEDSCLTPLGEMEIDAELRDLVKDSLDGQEDVWADNTVEVLLPIVKRFFPAAKLLWARFPAELSSFEAGKTLAKAALSLGRRVKVLGSTDLTHYGSAYGFSPRGSGPGALEWVKTVNDRRFIEAVIDGNPRDILDRAERERAACSAGAVLGALGFAEETAGKNRPAGRLLDYRTSADLTGDPGDSFVGYMAFLFWNDFR